MNGKQSKKIKKWCVASYMATPEADRNNMTLAQYENKVKEFWKITPKFQKFLTHSLEQHYLN